MHWAEWRATSPSRQKWQWPHLGMCDVTDVTRRVLASLTQSHYATTRVRLESRWVTLLLHLLTNGIWPDTLLPTTLMQRGGREVLYTNN